MSGRPYAVVGCSNCSAKWVTEGLRHHDSVTCPGCLTDHNTEKLRALARAETEEDAREMRSRILTDLSSADVDVDDVGYYATEEDAENAFSEYNEYYEAQAESLYDEYNEYYQQAAEEASGLFNDAFGEEVGAMECEHDERYNWLVEPGLQEFLEESESTPPKTGSLTYTDQAPVSAIVDVTVADHTPTAVWDQVVQDSRFLDAIVEGIREGAAGMTADEFREDVRGRGVPETYPELATRIARGDRRAVFQLLSDLRTRGSGTSTIDEIVRAIGLLSVGDRTPTVAITIGSEFLDRRSDQRRQICEIIAALGRSCDVRVVSGGIVRRQLASLHREELPGVSEACRATRGSPNLDATVEGARDALDHDSREVRILRELSDDPAQTLSYHAIESLFQVSGSRIRQCISTLVDLSLVDTFDGADGRAVELLKTGSEFVEALDADIGRQANLESCVSESGNSSIYCRVNPQPERGEGDGPRDRRNVGTAVEVEHYPRWRDAAVAGCASEGTMRLVDRPEAVSDELRQPYWSYDEDNERVIVGAEYNNPMQWWVCIARALVCYGMFDQALTPDRLDGDAGDLAGLLTDDLRILRDGRCLGYLKDADANGEDYADALRTAGEHLCKLTGVASDASGEERNELRRTVLKEAHGLAGTVAHLCDLAGIEIVREVRLPEFTRRFSDRERRDDLRETLSKGATIQSRLGHFAAYRQLFEDDEKKRSASMSPDVNASDPHGKMIGSFVLVGDNVSSFEDELVDKLRGPADLHEDAPEFDVGVPVRSYNGRPAFAQAIQETLDGKNLTPTREAVDIMTALTGNPYDVALAINKGLETEEKYPGRTIRADEIRVALSNLDDSWLLPNMPPSVGSIVSGLLTATEPLSQTELAERADVSTRSIRTHAPALEALGLLSESPEGYRLMISFDDEDDSIVPSPVEDTMSNAVDLLLSTLEVLVGDAACNADHPIGAAFFTEDPINELANTNPRLVPWIDVAVGLTGSDGDAPARIARFGKTPQQTSITEVSQ